MENELVAVDDSTAPSLANQFDIVDVEAAAAFMENYQDLVKRLLDKTDYQRVGDKHLKKKSAWRKLATAFNISDDIIKEFGIGLSLKDRDILTKMLKSKYDELAPRYELISKAIAFFLYIALFEVTSLVLI